MIVGVLKETFPGENRVALVPSVLPSLKKAGMDVLIESNAGEASGYPDSAYTEKEGKIATSRTEVFEESDCIVQIRLLGANPEEGKADVGHYKNGQLVIGMAEALSQPGSVQQLAGTGATSFALELMPRITRAQSMDILSSMATVAGYKAVLMAAYTLPKMFPMLMTAAGTVAPARVLIIGAGVAGLQAISVARRLGASVEAYDIRPAVKEQILSLGAKFVELPLETGDSEDKGGYAKAQDEAFYQKQRELLGKVIANSDIVVSTAAVPGKKAPVLVTGDMVSKMMPGSVIVDLAAERGGNCELTQPGKTVEVHGVTIHGPENLSSTVPFHASQMFAKNVATFLLHLVKKGEVTLDMEDEITKGTMMTKGGEVVHPVIREALGLASSSN